MKTCTQEKYSWKHILDISKFVDQFYSCTLWFEYDSEDKTRTLIFGSATHSRYGRSRPVFLIIDTTTKKLLFSKILENYEHVSRICSERNEFAIVHVSSSWKTPYHCRLSLMGGNTHQLTFEQFKDTDACFKLVHLKYRLLKLVL